MEFDFAYVEGFLNAKGIKTREESHCCRTFYCVLEDVAEFLAQEPGETKDMMIVLSGGRIN